MSPTPFGLAQSAAAAVTAVRFARGRRRRPPLAARGNPAAGTVSVVVPARDEAQRIAGCLAGLRGTGAEVVVVDDESADDTAAVARAHGARVVTGAALPAGWAGKAWALQQGLEAARGEWAVCLDADTEPRPGLLGALVEAAAPYELLSAGTRFECHGGGERMLHPAMAATLAYRFGPPDAEGHQPAPGRALANGQCLVVRRAPFLAAGGFAPVAASLVEDVALARAVRARGGRVGFVDAADLLSVRGYGSARATWTGWGRSLMAADATRAPAQAGDVALLWLAYALPLPRVLARRGTRLDVALVAARLGIHAALARSYGRPRGVPYALAPLLDAPVAAWLTWNAVRPDRTWRGRTYARPGSAAR